MPVICRDDSSHRFAGFANPVDHPRVSVALEPALLTRLKNRSGTIGPDLSLQENTAVRCDSCMLSRS
jgi:hypothetical protein